MGAAAKKVAKHMGVVAEKDHWFVDVDVYVNILPKENLPEADEGTSSTCSSDLETDDHSISENDEHLEEEIIPDDLYFGNYDII